MNPVKAESPPDQTAENLLLVIQGLVAEVHPQHPSMEVISLDSRFEKDLGLDSLTRVELIARVERYFELALPERSFAEVDTARDLLRAIQGPSRVGWLFLILINILPRYLCLNSSCRQSGQYVD